MSLLLDTHVWFWSVTAPERLSVRARAAIEDGETRLHVSAATWWEIELLSRKGELDFGADLDAWFAFATREYPVVEEPISWQIASRSARLDLPQRDPADRFIAATAVERGLTLVTKDRALRDAPGVPTFDW